MEERIKIVFLALLLAAGLMLVSFIGGWSLRGRKCEGGGMRYDTVTVYHTDTITLTETEKIHDTIREVFYKTVKVAVDGSNGSDGNDVLTGLRDDGMTDGDSVWVTLPYERHFVSLDSVADVWYSGYDAKIDSARVYRRTVTQVINKPYEVVRMPKLTLDLGAGAMWHERAVKPYAVGKLSLNRPHTTFTAFGAVNYEGDWAAGVSVTYRISLVK